MDIYTLNTHTVISRSGCELTAEALVLNGYLGGTPQKPSLAVSL
jgi:hypothetical protein